MYNDQNYWICTGKFLFFSQTRDNWPFNTGIEIFWLEMHIKKYDVATCTSYWERLLMNHKQLSSKVSKNLNCMYLFIVRVSPAIPLYKTQSHKNIWPFHTSRIISKFFHAHAFEIFHMKVKSEIPQLNFQFPSLDQSQVTNDDRMSYIICSRTIRGLLYDFYWSI